MNKKLLIRIIVIVLAVLIVGGAVAGGVYIYLKNRNKISNQEAVKILEDLIPKAEEVNELIWGEGLPVAEGEREALKSVTGAQYRRVDADAGYKNTDAIRKAVKAVYSDRYIKGALNTTLFDGESSEVGELYPRYKDNDDGELIIDITNPGLEIGTKIDPSTAKVTKVHFKEITVSVEATLSTGDKTTIDLVLYKQGDDWRLDTPTY